MCLIRPLGSTAENILEIHTSLYNDFNPANVTQTLPRKYSGPYGSAADNETQTKTLKKTFQKNHPAREGVKLLNDCLRLCRPVAGSCHPYPSHQRDAWFASCLRSGCSSGPRLKFSIILFLARLLAVSHSDIFVCEREPLAGGVWGSEPLSALFP